MRRLLADTTESLAGLGGFDLLDNLTLTVLEDERRFNGASTAVIRDHFKQWAATMERQEQGPSLESQQPRYPGSQRYRYCIQVTQEILD
ncbi:hypothetical protein BDV59DRAFT_180489 [Aspergillus ambiguus]|uniref:uncharacterized protein n=1 Tax=Aspergillus ambiguus TaxID=176160 RepID=UPI003CCCF2DF